MKTNLDCITVNVPTLNEEENIAECISRIKKSGIKNIIVVDGGSTDNTKKILKKLNIKFYETYEKGLAYQRNLAIKKTKSKYVALINADERVNKNTFNTMLNDLKKNLPNCAGVQAQIISSKKKENYFERAFQLLADINLNKKTTRKMIGSPTLWKTHILKKNNFDPFFSGPSDDTDLCYRLYRKGYIFGSSMAIVNNAHRDSLLQFFKKFLWYGKGDAQFIIKHKQRIFSILKHQLFNYPIKFSLIAFARLKIIYIPFFVIMGLSRFIGMIIFLLKYFLGFKDKIYST
tara:strand:- start:24814 stop:25680 length:867 start_codon:yes stop_codon:yes gene_type:complete